MKYIAEHHRAFLVGGSVRDYLLEKTPDDDDIVVMEHPRHAALRLARHIRGSFVELGKADMTVFRVVSGTHIFDISPPKGNSLEEDLSRRDFTINAMAIDLSSGSLIDPLNGHDDLKHKIVRMVSEQSFTDDPLRLLRAFRMSAILNFGIEEKDD
ncbi:MAG: CCA tRNA nucleotidyltransferase [Desulfobacteraceae bacterium]|nr:CCA tRNA nucleotidyltransferase [Desulfobacteraceae bacterium]